MFEYTNAPSCDNEFLGSVVSDSLKHVVTLRKACAHADQAVPIDVTQDTGRKIEETTPVFLAEHTELCRKHFGRLACPNATAACDHSLQRLVSSRRLRIPR